MENIESSNYGLQINLYVILHNNPKNKIKTVRLEFLILIFVSHPNLNKQQKFLMLKREKSLNRVYSTHAPYHLSWSQEISNRFLKRSIQRKYNSYAKNLILMIAYKNTQNQPEMDIENRENWKHTSGAASRPGWYRDCCVCCFCKSACWIKAWCCFNLSCWCCCCCIFPNTTSAEYTKSKWTNLQSVRVYCETDRSDFPTKKRGGMKRENPRNK